MLGLNLFYSAQPYDSLGDINIREIICVSSNAGDEGTRKACCARSVSPLPAGAPEAAPRPQRHPPPPQRALPPRAAAAVSEREERCEGTQMILQVYVARH